MHDIRKNPLEWLVFGSSTVLVLGLLAFLGYISWTYPDSPARMEIHLGKPTKVGQSWQVKVEVQNQGTHTAEGVEVEVEWPAQKQIARFVLPHLPRQGKRVGYAVFESKGETEFSISVLKARVTGYEEG